MISAFIRPKGHSIQFSRALALSVATMAGWSLQWAPAHADGRTQQDAQIEFRVFVNGQERGLVGAMVMDNRLLAIDGVKLAELLRPVAPQKLVERVRAAAGGDKIATIRSLRQLPGMSFAYDLPRRRIDIWLPPSDPPAPEPPAPARIWPKTLNLPLYVDLAYAGDIGVTLKGVDVEGMDAVRLLELLKPLAAPSVVSAVQIASGDDRLATFAEMAPVRGISFSYDPERLRIDATLLAQAKPIGSLSAGFTPRQRARDALKPAGFSGALSASTSIDYVHESTVRAGDVGSPFAVGTARMFVSFGGFEGLAAAADVDFDTRDGQGARRGPATILHDDYDRAIRYAALDLTAPAAGFLAPVPLGGVAVSRSFADLQPWRNIRPGGSGRFVLERSSLVQVEVNGVIVRTLRLEAGTYDIRDFALTEGVNDVRLFVEDEAGRREVANFSIFFASTLLEKGISEFALALGAPRSFTNDGVDYASDAPVATGFYRRGMSESVTLGVNAQANERTRVAGFELDVATLIGSVRFEAAASDDKVDNTGYAGRAGWRTMFGGVNGFRTGELEMAVEAFSDAFRRPTDDLAPQRTFEGGIRYRQTFFEGVGVSTGYAYARGRVRADDEKRTSASISKSFGRFNVLASVDHLERPEREDETQGLIALSWRVGERGLARARYQSSRDAYGIEYDRPSQERLHDVGVRLSAVRDDEEGDLEGELDYVGNRFEAGLRTDVLMDPRSGDTREIASSARLAFGVGVAGGSWGMGRAPRDAFAIVSTHETLGQRNAKISRRAGSDQTIAETGAMGSVLVPLDRPYQNDQLLVAVDELPVGYDLGAARFELFPGQWTGYDLEVGSEASNTIMGILQDDSGAPVPLVAGKLLRENDPVATPIEFFTNRTGRFVAERARPGLYRMVLPDGRVSAERIMVPPSATGLVRVGVVKVGV